MATGTFPTTLNELFNEDAIKLCLKSEAVWEEQKVILRRYLRDSKPSGTKGAREFAVRYDYGTDYRKAQLGRVYAKGATGLQSMWHQIRNAIAGEYYWDLDMVNAQPTILYAIATKNGWSAPLLGRYIAERDAVLAEAMAHYGVKRETAKDLFCRMLYLGTEATWRDASAPGKHPYPFALQFATEMATLAQLMVGKHADIRKTTNKVKGLAKDDMGLDAQKGVMSFVLQTAEHKVLMAANGYLNSVARPLHTFIFDGGLIRRLEGERECPAEVLRGIEAAVLATTGYETRWISKPMAVDPTELDLSAVALTTDDTVESLTGIIDDVYAAREFVKLMADHIARDGDTLLCFNPTTGMWDSDPKALMGAAVRNAGSLVFTEMLDDGKEKKHNYGGCVAKMTAMLQVVPHLVRDTRFIERNAEKATGKMLFANGIYDFRTGEFTEGFDPSVVFFAALDRPFQPRSERNETLITEIHDALFVKPFLSAEDPKNDMGTFYKEFLARSIAGEYHHKKLVAGVGNRNTGKGVTTDAMLATFGRYVGTFDANNLLVNTRMGKDESQKLMWLKPLRTTRLMISNEVDVVSAGDAKGAANRPLNGNLINRLASGGDEITLRGICQEDMKIRWRSNVVMLSNDMPPVAPVNEGVRERFRNIRWSKSFKMVTDESELGPNELKADPKWRTIFSTDIGYQHAFFWVLADAYLAIKDRIFFDPACVAAETKEWLGEASNVRIREALEEAYVITGKPEHVVAFTELKAHLATAGLGVGMSDTKLGRELTSLGLEACKANLLRKVVAARKGIRERTEADDAPAGGAGQVPAGDIADPFEGYGGYGGAY